MDGQPAARSLLDVAAQLQKASAPVTLGAAGRRPQPRSYLLHEPCPSPLPRRGDCLAFGPAVSFDPM
jgi:hypothetical protein